MAQQSAFKVGEWFKFRIHYGFITAGYATLEVDNARLEGKAVFHIKGEGKTVGLSKLFFKVEDVYQSYIDKEKNIPYRFIRKIDEGGHTKDIQIDFNQEARQALVFNKKYNKKEIISTDKEVQDMISTLYYLRNTLDISNLKIGDVKDLTMFFDNENYKFKLKFIKREILTTKFGKIKCLVFRPYVQAGRVFKRKESMTVWVSDDDNKIPVLIKAKLSVGSLKASLSEFKGLKHSFKIIVD